jgi:hypothetical protein
LAAFFFSPHFASLQKVAPPKTKHPLPALPEANAGGKSDRNMAGVDLKLAAEMWKSLVGHS